MQLCNFFFFFFVVVTLVRVFDFGHVSWFAGLSHMRQGIELNVLRYLVFYKPYLGCHAVVDVCC